MQLVRRGGSRTAPTSGWNDGAGFDQLSEGATSGRRYISLRNISDITMDKNVLNSPVESSDRIESLDVLRGFAVFGILVMNIQAFAMPGAAYFNPRLMAISAVSTFLLGWLATCSSTRSFCRCSRFFLGPASAYCRSRRGSQRSLGRLALPAHVLAARLRPCTCLFPVVGRCIGHVRAVRLRPLFFTAPLATEANGHRPRGLFGGECYLHRNRLDDRVYPRERRGGMADSQRCGHRTRLKLMRSCSRTAADGSHSRCGGVPIRWKCTRRSCQSNCSGNLRALC